MTELTQAYTPALPFYRFSFYTALGTTFLTILTFVIAILTPPLSGPFCQSGCYQYPYLDIASRFPRDYYWMYPATILTLAYIALVSCIFYQVPSGKKVFGLIGLSFSLMASLILSIDYFVQITVIQPSLLQGETDGIAIFTQYNPHGLFIALEELGYLLMSLSFACLAPVFSKDSLLEKSIRRIFLAGFFVTLLALGMISILYGIHREYRFEVAVITIDWLVLFINGILLTILFGRKRKIYAHG
jgi:hypothetical protein